MSSIHLGIFLGHVHLNNKNLSYRNTHGCLGELEKAVETLTR